MGLISVVFCVLHHDCFSREGILQLDLTNVEWQEFAVSVLSRCTTAGTACCAIYSPLTSHLSPLTTHHSPLTTRLSPIALPLTTCLSPITTHLSPITNYLSPLTSHHLPMTTSFVCLRGVRCRQVSGWLVGPLGDTLPPQRGL